MATPNPFDQFDAPQAPGGASNPFDQFDQGATAPQAALAQASPSFAQQLQSRALSAGQAIGSAQAGTAEMLLRRATGALAAIPSGAAYGGAAIGRALGANVNPAEVQGRVQEYFTYDPVTQAGQGGEQALRQLTQPILQPIARGLGQLATQVGQVSPVAETMLREAPAAAGAAGGIVPAAQLARAAVPNIPGAAQEIAQGMQSAGQSVARRLQPAPSAEEVLARMQSGQSMGAAGAAPALSGVSPEFRQAISRQAQRTGGIVNPEVLGRHMEAETLPVPVRLTEGQATQRPILLSDERNLRGAEPRFAEHFNTQGRQLAQNVQALRDRVGPEVFTTNAVEHADTLIESYRRLDRAAQDEIGRRYQALRDANGGAFPVDAPVLLNNATAALHQQLLFDHAPKAVMSTLNRLAESNNMTFENFESLRTNLARIQRTSTDGNEVAAAGVIRNAMEALPLRTEAARLKPLADDARSAARAHFDELRADPAYMAAVNNEVPADRFAQRFVIGAPRDDVIRMRQNLQGDDRALQTLGTIAVDYLRDQARLGPHYEGRFASVSFNKALQGLQPKLQALVDPRTAEDFEKLANVSRYISSQPEGTFVNNSGTFVAGARNATVGAVEGAANVAAAGIPVGTWGRKAAEALTRGRRVNRALAPGAGLDILQTSPQIEAMMQRARERAGIR